MKFNLKTFGKICCLALLIAQTAIAQNNDPKQEAVEIKKEDPYERFNRSVFCFNKLADKVIIKPVAYVYLKYLPEIFQLGIGNFFDNIREANNVANDLLQAKFAYAAHDLSRFVVNSTIGLMGFFDPALSLGLESRKEDFGQTLYHWGYKQSAYLMLPFLGPATVRDGVGMGVDFFALSLWAWMEFQSSKYILMSIDYVDLRSRILIKEPVMDILAVDEYVFIRNAYLQRREYLFNGGSVPIAEEADPYEQI